MEIIASEMTSLTNEELFVFDGGVDWDDLATAAWIAGGTGLCLGGPVCKAAGFVCCCFAAGYYIGKGIAG